MQPKQVHDFLFQLYDYADYLADRIEAGDPESRMFFLSLVFIEKMFDTYGRGLISESAHNANDPALSGSESLTEAHRRVDVLRARIDQLAKANNYDSVLEDYSHQLATEWPHSRPTE